ncbi:MAG: alkaline phosphatase family protein [Clostridia bacterium]|nr:alkaline phosphatase family protein [Clostridia bacterium]
MKKTVSLILAALLLMCSVGVAFAADAGETYDSFGAYERVFIIGIDGLGATFDMVDSPNFDRIFADNAYRYDAHTEYVTVSAQNWGSILTGVDYTTHGLTNDCCEDNERTSADENNTIFYYARQAFPDAQLVSFNNWDAINHGIIENDLGVKKINRGTDPLVVDAILKYINNEKNDPKLMFVQLDSVDHAAHTYGGFSQQYYDAAAKADVWLGEIYDAIEARGFMENSLFILVADHGETTDGHGGQTKEESSAVLAVAGHSVNATVLGENVQNRDVSAIALYALGVEKPAHFISVVPEELFGESREKTVEPNPMKRATKLFRKFLYLFVRMVNLLVGIFDK